MGLGLLYIVLVALAGLWVLVAIFAQQLDRLIMRWEWRRTMRRAEKWRAR